MSTELLNVSEAAAALRVSGFTIRAWVAARKLASIRLGRAVRIPRGEIDRLVEEGLTPARRERGAVA